MTVHSETEKWVLAVSGATRLLAERRLVGGWTSDMRVVEVGGRGGRRDLVLRRLYRDPWAAHAEALLTREAGVLELLAGSSVPVARLIGLDAKGSEADAPALLMTRLPGRLALESEVLLSRLAPLASVLSAIHSTKPRQRPRAWESWAVPERCVVPDWTSDPDLWQRAFAALECEVPEEPFCFIHRDFHPGNVLWDGQEVSGIVDWVEASWGPAALDVAHCCTALALLGGVETAKAFRAAYRNSTGAPEPGAYWQLIDIIGFLPDPEKVAKPWRCAGREDLSAAVAQRELEILLTDTLARLGDERRVVDARQRRGERPQT